MAHQLDFRGRTALITGATGGIGRAIAQALSEGGANVVIHGRVMESAVDEVLDHCRAQGVRASFVGADLFGAPEKTVDQVFHAALSAEPGIDLLINNAGGAAHYGPFVDVTFEQFHQMVNFNLGFGYFLTQRFVKRWLDSRTGGRVLMSGSINGQLAEVGSSLYDALKGAIGMLVKSLAAELAGKGIRVNGIAPGLILTSFTSGLENRPEDAAWMRLHTPNGKIPGPESCVGAALYLLSDLADHVHGQMLFVDGGMSVWQQPPRPE